MVRGGVILRRLLLATIILGLGAAIIVIVATDRSSAQVMVYHHPHGPWLGVSIQNLTEELAKAKKLDIDEGALVNDVVDDSPAEKAGIQEGDVIVEFNHRDIDDADDLVRAVRRTDAGGTVEVVVIRDGKEVKLEATLRIKERPRRAFRFGPRMLRIPRLFSGSELAGMELQELSKQLGEYFNAPNGRGVLVTDVEEESAADEAGFKAGDVIVRVEEERVKDIEDIWDGLEDADERGRAKFELIRKSQRLTLELELDENEDFSFEQFEFRYPEQSWRITVPEIRTDELEHFKEDIKQFREHMKSFREDLQGKVNDFQEKFRKKMQNVYRRALMIKET